LARQLKATLNCLALYRGPTFRSSQLNSATNHNFYHTHPTHGFCALALLVEASTVARLVNYTINYMVQLLME
jgi:hypothetical protein